MSRTSLIPFLALLAACTGSPTTTTSAVDPETPDANRATLEQLTEAFGSPDAVEAPPVVLLYPVGKGARVPRKLALRSNHVAFGGLRGELPDADAVRISPPTPGSFAITGSHELTFTASEGLLPDTEYTLTVERFGLGDTTLTNGDQPWVRTFRTPKLELVQLSLAQVRVPGQAVDVDLEFTAPVDAQSVLDRARFSLDGTEVTGATLLASNDPNSVRMRLPALDWAKDAKLMVNLDAGSELAMDADLTAPASTRTTQLSTGPAMSVQSAKLREGAEGWYIEVFCDDASVDQKMSYYDREDWDYYWLSSRCMLDEDDALSHIHVEPDPGDLQIAPGPAGFRIFGSFPRGDVKVRIDAGARTQDGGTLQTKWESSHRVAARSSMVSLVSKGRYLPRSAWKNLAVKHRNVEALEVTIRHVPEDNLVFWMGGEEPADDRTSNVVVKRVVRVEQRADEIETEWLDVAAWLPQTDNGLYQVSVRGIEDLSAPAPQPDADDDENTAGDTGFWWDEPEVEVSSGGPVDATRLMLTDIQLVAKVAEAPPGTRWSPKMTVFALGTHDNQPLSRTKIEVVRRSGTAMASCTTDARGGCTIELPDSGPDDSKPFALIARRHGDLAYLKFADLELDTPADTEGEPWFGAAPYRASAWTDRGVYRPGEMAHVAAIVRDEALTAPDEALPVVLKLYDPKGKELRRKLVEANSGGMVSGDFAFADFATTGPYRVDVEVAERVVGTVRFNVEEFVPERMAVEAQAIDDGYLASDDVPVDVEARWLFGGNAAGAEVELTCRLVPAAFKPSQHATYTYGRSTVGEAPRPLDLGGRKGVLDADGRTTMDCDAASVSGGLDGPARLVANAAVFEGESGRSTLGTASVPVHPETYYVGLSTNASKAEPGKPIAVEGVVVDWQGALDPGAVTEVDVELYRLVERYGYTWDEASGRSRYQRVLRRSREERLTVPVRDGKLRVELTPEAHAAGYLVVARSGDTRTELHVEGTGRRWWWSGETASVDQTPRPDKPTDLHVRVPGDVEVGRTVPVKVTAPYSGRMLFTVETHEVVLYEWHEVAAGEVEWTFSLEEFAPNVYVSAMLVKDPHLESPEAYLPDRAYGIANLAITPSEFVHDMKLIVPPEVRPRQPMRVDIDLGPQDEESWVAVAAVDEGVLSLTDFDSPDPFDDIFAQRELGVTSYETVGWSLLVPPMGPSSRTGGDQAGGGGGRVQMVKPVALWSGLVKVPRSGTAHVNMDIPGYQGELRVMAVSAGSKKMGHASKSVTVRDPLVLQPTLPRFLAAGDRADIPVFVSNVSGKTREIEVRLSVDEMEAWRPEHMAGGDLQPVVEILTQRTQTVTLKDGESASVLFGVRVNRAPSAARFRIDADGGEVSSWDELEVPIQTTAPEVRMSETVELLPGDNNLAALFEGWQHGSDRSNVWITSNPYGEAMNHLKYAVRYPYGCVEQTTSSTRPLLYVRSFVDDIDPMLTKQKGSVDDMVMHGVDRLLSMQTPSGGLAYWPGGSSPHAWGTTYGGHVLIDAKEAGYPVPEQPLDDAMDWLALQLNGRDPSQLHEHRETAYMHYVLARSGRGRPALAQKHLEALDGRLASGDHDEARFLYQASMYLAGDRRHESALRAPGADSLDWARLNDHTFYSDLRDRALTLNLYADLFGTDAAGQDLAALVGQGLQEKGESHHYTTQELGWGLSGLGKWVQGLAEGELDGVAMSVDGNRLVADDGEEDDYSWSLARASLAQDVVVTVPQFDFDGKVFAVVTTEGTRDGENVPTGGSGLELERQIVTADGRPASEAKLGDPLYARVALTNTTGRNLVNVAMVDRIPAGLEIENPRLGREGVPEALGGLELWHTDHMNLRDDRVELFGTIPAGQTRYVVYGVRAVTAGEFTQPPVSAEAMYDPTRWARELGGTFVVHAPWEEGS